MSDPAEVPSIGTRRMAIIQTRLDLVERNVEQAAHDSQVARLQVKALDAQVSRLAERVTMMVIESGERAERDSVNIGELRKMCEALVASVEARNREIIAILTKAAGRL